MDYQGFALAMSKPWACKINKTVPRLLGFDCKGLDLLICSFLNVQHATVSGQISLNNTIQWRVSRPAIHPISVQPMPTKGRTGAADLTKKNNANFSRKEARADKGCSRPQAPDQQINPTAKHTSSRSRKEKQTNDIVWVCLSNTEILKLARAPRTESEATAGPYLFGDILLIGALLLAGIKADLAWFGCRSWGVRSMLKNVEDTVWSCMEALGSLWQACWRMCSFCRCPCSIWTTKSQKIAAGVWCMLAMHTLTPICHTSRRCHHGLDISRFFQDPSSQPQGMNVHMLDPGKKTQVDSHVGAILCVVVGWVKTSHTIITERWTSSFWKGYWLNKSYSDTENRVLMDRHLSHAALQHHRAACGSLTPALLCRLCRS